MTPSHAHSTDGPSLACHDMLAVSVVLAGALNPLREGEACRRAVYVRGYATTSSTWQSVEARGHDKDSDRYKVVNLIGVAVCNSIPRETHRGPARVRPSVPWSP